MPITDVGKTPQEPENEDSTKKLPPEERRERIQKLLSGKIPPPNSVVSYAVDQARRAMAEGDHAQKQRIFHREQATALDQRVREIQGKHQQCIADIEHWDRPDALTQELQELPETLS